MLLTLENHLHSLTALFEDALANGGLAAGRASRAATPLRTRGANYPFTELQCDDLEAGAGGLDGSGVLRFDQARIIHALVLDRALIDDMHAALATSGGRVTIEFQVRSAVSLGGTGQAALAGWLITAVQHAAGGRTIIDRIPDLRAAPPGGTVDTPYVVDLTQHDVTRLAPGDTIYVAALAVGGVYAGVRNLIDPIVLHWTYARGGHPRMRLRPLSRGDGRLDEAPFAADVQNGVSVSP